MYFNNEIYKMNIEIRKAKEIEIDVLLEFEKRIIEVEKPFDNTLKDSEIHYYDLIRLINSDKAEVLVAVLNNEIVDRKSTRLNSSHSTLSRMPSSA